ncbi:MAG: hypothetical protein IPN68_03420 [Bacteroidetes bacterium]|nr:hypothetical protein [Bacteroidota bacterium]
MKKLIMCIMALYVSFTFIPVKLNAASNIESSSPSASGNARPPESKEVKAKLLRLDEIKAIDKSELKSSERKELRSEANALHSEVRHSHGGFYISGGAVILILILIILL